jgi:hypothetical protein
MIRITVVVLVLALCDGSAVPRLGALIFQSRATTQELSPVIESVKDHVRHIVVCQPEQSTREMEGYMSEWSRYTHIPSAVHKGTRNACLRVYTSLAPPTVVTVVLVEWNMRLHVNGSIPMSSWHHDVGTGADNGADYAVAPDQSGLVMDWTPLVMRVTARCGYLGRFICVDSAEAHRHLLLVDYELDVDKETRQVIERDIIPVSKYPPPVLSTVYITRIGKLSRGGVPEPPADPEFAYAWYWMGRECELQMEGDTARMAFTRRLDLSDDPGDRWYATYRLGDMTTNPVQATYLLLEAYDLQPRRREPLAALMRRYADEGKYGLCQLFGSTALALPFPAGPQTGPHVELPVYEWMVADEYSVCLAHLGHAKEAADLARRLLATSSMTTMPVDQRKRIEENIAIWSPPAEGK